MLHTHSAYRPAAWPGCVLAVLLLAACGGRGKTVVYAVDSGATGATAQSAWRPPRIPARASKRLPQHTGWSVYRPRRGAPRDAPQRIAARPR